MLTISHKQLLRRKFKRGIKRLKYGKSFTHGDITVHKVRKINVCIKYVYKNGLFCDTLTMNEEVVGHKGFGFKTSKGVKLGDSKCVSTLNRDIETINYNFNNVYIVEGGWYEIAKDEDELFNSINRLSVNIRYVVLDILLITAAIIITILACYDGNDDDSWENY